MLRTLCKPKTCSLVSFSRSQRMMFAMKPMWVCCPDARYLPDEDSAMQDTWIEQATLRMQFRFQTCYC